VLTKTPPCKLTRNDEQGIILDYSDKQARHPRSSQPQDGALALILQQLSLPPQRVSLEPPESALDPVPAIAIAANLLPGPESPRQQAHLAAEKDPATAQQAVRRHVAESAGLHGGRHVGERVLFARGKS